MKTGTIPLHSLTCVRTFPRKALVFLCLSALCASLSLAFQPPATVHSTTTGQQRKQQPRISSSGAAQSSTKTRTDHHHSCDRPTRRAYPIFLASAGDEGIADSDVPMAISLIGATTSIFVAGTFYLVLAWQRNALMVAFFLGSIGNGVLSKVLKRIINQSRPPDLATAEMSLKPSDGGMPSSHAMSLGFIGTFTALHVSWTPLPILLYIVVSLWYRVKVKLHTAAQIMVGVTVGAANALCFDTFVKDGLMEWLRQYVLDSNGLLPLPLLVVPLIVGALLVGSVERRISQWLANQRTKAL